MVHMRPMCAKASGEDFEGPRTVTRAQAKKMPLLMNQYPNDALIMLAAQGSHEAREECVIREIMAVDDVDWDGAQPRMAEIRSAALSGMGLAKLPYRAAITGAVVGGFVTFPLCFHLNTVEWFNDAFVTDDLPDAKELETWLEVGSWSWNWMEPVLGQLSFFLLTLQYARAQMQNIGLKPYTEWLCNRRAMTLSQKFPQYNDRVLHEYSYTLFRE